MTAMAVDARHSDKNGEISRKHGKTLIYTLRKTYGLGFAPGCGDHAKLSDVLGKLDDPSLSQLIRDHEAGKLEQICRSGGVRGAGTEPAVSPPQVEQRGSRSR
jgi:hypothetical protein